MNSMLKRAELVLPLIGALALPVAIPAGAASAREALEPAPGWLQTGTRKAPGALQTTEWSVDPSSQSAIVRANNSASGIFAGG